jgi:hypothetical protein
MANPAIEFGAFTWTPVQRLHDAVPAVHWQRCEAEGLQCPLEVFTQLFRTVIHRSFVVFEDKRPVVACMFVARDPTQRHPIPGLVENADADVHPEVGAE